MPDWEELGSALQCVLRDFQDGARLIVAADHPPGVYVQAAQDDGVLVVEAVSDQFLPGARDDRATRLRSVGWDEPASEFENWSHELQWPASTAEYRIAAEMMVRSLRDVDGVPSPDSLRYRAWNDVQSPAELKLPDLGLRREES